jgi:hypothetical protein
MDVPNKLIAKEIELLPSKKAIVWIFVFALLLIYQKLFEQRDNSWIIQSIS